MALSILDGNQSATTLSTILSSGQHITAHTVVSLGTQAITDMRGAVSGSVVSISNFPSTQTIAGTVTANLANVVTTDLYSVSSAVKVTGADGQGVLLGGLNSIGNPENVYEGGAIPVRGSVGMDVPISGTVTANPTGTQTIAGTVTANGIAFNAGEATPDKAVWIAYNLNNTLEGVSDSAPLPISGTVTANLAGSFNQAIETVGDVSNASQAVAVHLYDDGGTFIGNLNNPFYVSGTVAIGSALPTGTNRIGVVTIGGGTVTLGAGTAQIGSVTASISNSVTIASLPAISGTVTANTFALQGTAVTTSNFTSTTASTVLANYNATREVLTIFNEGAGNLHICAGATCTTIAYQVRLSAGDYYEVPNHQTTITHSAVFATAGTARICQVS